MRRYAIQKPLGPRQSFGCDGIEDLLLLPSALVINSIVFVDGLDRRLPGLVADHLRTSATAAGLEPASGGPRFAIGGNPLKPPVTFVFADIL